MLYHALIYIHYIHFLKCFDYRTLLPRIYMFALYKCLLLVFGVVFEWWHIVDLFGKQVLVQL